MAITEMDELIKNGLQRALEIMTVAAYNSIKFNNRNTVKIIAIDEEEVDTISQFCLSLADMSPLGARDGRALQEFMKEPLGMLIIGDKRKSDFNYNCGACGYRTCAELNKAEEMEALTSNGPMCLFRAINMHMAAKAAAARSRR